MCKLDSLIVLVGRNVLALLLIGFVILFLYLITRGKLLELIIIFIDMDGRQKVQTVGAVSIVLVVALLAIRSQELAPYVAAHCG